MQALLAMLNNPRGPGIDGLKRMPLPELSTALAQVRKPPSWSRSWTNFSPL
jgi:hypothetical protein